jgi:hypothetical protein
MTGLEFDEFNGRAQRSKIDRKAWGGLLAHERLAHHLVAAVDADYVAGNECGGEEREPHDVVPMQMRHEDIKSMLAGGSVAGQQAVAELARARAEIAEYEFVAAGD